MSSYKAGEDMIKIKTVYVDMDGVLADFDKKYHQFFGITPAQGRRDSYAQYSARWNNFIDNKGFACLDWFEGGSQLVIWLNKQRDRGLIDIAILSSSGGLDRHNEVREQKVKWLCDKGITWPSIIVPGKQYKAAFASGKTALIDDTLSNVEQFTANGGLGIRHLKDEKWKSTYTIECWINGETINAS